MNADNQSTQATVLAFLLRYGNWIVIGGLALWLIVGFLPTLGFGVGEKAGQFGDSFGTATSLFTGIGFAFALLALMMQIQESKDAGEQQLKQEQLELKQVELQAEQAKVARRQPRSPNAPPSYKSPFVGMPNEMPG